MSPRVFALPDLGEGLTDAGLVRWLVAVGDVVTVDQPIAEVETAKSVVEVPTPFAGVVAALHGEEGETVLVGAPLIEVGDDAPAVAPEGPPAPMDAPAPAPDGGSGQVLVGYGTTDHATVRRRSRTTASSTITAPAPGRVVPVVSPVVRALAHRNGVDIAALRPSGEGGVVTRRDVEAAIFPAAPAPTEPATAPAPTAATSGPTAEPAVAPEPAVRPEPAPTPAATPAVDPRTGLALAATTPFSRFRRTVADAMVRSRSEIPEATVWVDADATELWDARRRLASAASGGRAPSLLAFIGRFALASLVRHPELGGRVSADGTALETFNGVNLGVAADTPRGLVVPVVRRADRMSVLDLDAAIGALAAAAREGTLPPADLTGSTFTVNNYGSLGVDGSAAIINHPEVAILGVGRMIERPWVVDGAVVPRRIVQLSLVFDHRVTDGGVAAGFLREVADAVESPFAFLAAEAPGTV
ncbi:dihydrolipoamide acetyltransferase family protein [Leifsonia sp. NPDC080035]|uniref:Dihydrolipoamide acetyltransferase component of pyruvate dehydrogenase complex n=1 Tax=Leifsonia sp. NPDC080035 TaxID=3143936 RepID=A0AAU7GD18_9MICO